MSGFPPLPDRLRWHVRENREPKHEELWTPGAIQVIAHAAHYGPNVAIMRTTPAGEWSDWIRGGRTKPSVVPTGWIDPYEYEQELRAVDQAVYELPGRWPRSARLPRVTKVAHKFYRRREKERHFEVEWAPLPDTFGQKDIIKAAEVALEKFMEAEAQKRKRAYQSSLYGIYPPKVLHIQTKEEEQ